MPISKEQTIPFYKKAGLLQNAVLSPTHKKSIFKKLWRTAACAVLHNFFLASIFGISILQQAQENLVAVQSTADQSQTAMRKVPIVLKHFHHVYLI